MRGSRNGLYTGAAPCHGCRKSGTENPRWSKDELCQDCKELIRRGKAAEVESAITYKPVRQHYFAYNDDRLNKIVHQFLAAANNPTAKTNQSSEALKQCFGDNCVYYVIDSRLFEPMQTLFSEMETRMLEIKKEKEALEIRKQNEIPSLVALQIQAERTRIFNEGIAEGRNLLKQLNAGQITLADLETNKSYTGI